MMLIPLQAVPSQVVTCLLASQQCKIAVSQKNTGIFVNLYVNDALVIGGVIAEDRNRIVRSLYLGFIGDLAFFDIQGKADPYYTGIGTRYVLAYLSPDEIDAADAALAERLIEAVAA